MAWSHGPRARGWVAGGGLNSDPPLGGAPAIFFLVFSVGVVRVGGVRRVGGWRVAVGGQSMTPLPKAERSPIFNYFFLAVIGVMVQLCGNEAMDADDGEASQAFLSPPFMGAVDRSIGRGGWLGFF